MTRQYPNAWYRIEPYAPASNQALSAQADSCQKEIVADSKGRKHFFNWSIADKQAVAGYLAGVAGYISTHETTSWASDTACLSYNETFIKRTALNCPLKDAQAVEDFKFFITRMVDRYDADGKNDVSLTCICNDEQAGVASVCPKDPDSLKRSIDLWQLGAEYNSIDSYWHGTTEEYLVGWRAFVEAVRAENKNALIVSNGLANIDNIANIEAGGIPSAVQTFSQFYNSAGTKALPYLTAGEAERAQKIKSNPKNYPTADSVIAAMRLEDVTVEGKTVSAEQKEVLLRTRMDAPRFRVAFKDMILAHPELFDVFESRLYYYHKFDPTRTARDFANINAEFSKHGYTKPVVTGEANGATLGSWVPSIPKDYIARMLSHVNSYVAKKIYKTDTGAVTAQEAEDYALYNRDLASGEVIAHALFFAEGGASYIQWKLFDNAPGDNFEDPEIFSILGLIYPKLSKSGGGVPVKKPAFYTYALMTGKLKGFAKAEYVGGNKEAVVFTVGGKKVVIAWSMSGKKTIDLSALLGDKVTLTHIVTALDAQNKPIYKPMETVQASAVPVTDLPVFIEPVK